MSMRELWSYEVYELTNYPEKWHVGELARFLNTQGEKGFELAEMIVSPGSARLVFKRPIVRHS